MISEGCADLGPLTWALWENWPQRCESRRAGPSLASCNILESGLALHTESIVELALVAEVVGKPVLKV